MEDEDEQILETSDMSGWETQNCTENGSVLILHNLSAAFQVADDFSPPEIAPLKATFHATTPNILPAAKSLQSCPILCDPIDSSSPGSPIPGILQARTLEWVAISFPNILPASPLFLLPLTSMMECARTQPSQFSRPTPGLSVCLYARNTDTSLFLVFV